MAAQLYPPIISDRIPAFYIENTENGIVIPAIITVPFSMNKAVKISEIKGFSLKIKTVQTGKIITTINNNIQIDIDNFPKQINFEWINDISEKYIGQFLKIQMAYIGENGLVGLYSDVSIVKCTAKPRVYIEEFEEFFKDNNDEQPAFNYTYTGVYENEDTSEKPYLYNFILYGEDDNIIEESGWQLYNLNEDITKKVYTFQTFIDEFQTYQVEYKIKTINDLEKSSGLYSCNIPTIETTNILQLKAENVFDEGYINLSFSLNNEENINNNEQIKINLYRKNKNTKEYPILLQKVYFENMNDISDWSFKDFAIEQGITYIYMFKYERNLVESVSFTGEEAEIVADFEDMFLWDGERQIKIRFNPKVSSFKINRQEQKIETIGSRFPVFFRNGKIQYKEFPISGLISYHLDDNELFIQNSLQELGIQKKDFERLGTNSTEQDESFDSKLFSIKNLNLISNNIKAERQFKLKLLEWLSDGKIKLFKSPIEGNYLIKLLNISLSPEDKVGRMLHSFSCTAYEVDEYTYENLIKNGLIIIKNFNFLQESSPLDTFSFKVQYIYGEGDGDIENPNTPTVTIGEDSSINGFALGNKKKNILIFNNKKIQTLNDFNYLLLKSSNDKLLIDNNDNIIVTTAVPQIDTLSQLQDIIYHNSLKKIREEESIYYWAQDDNNKMHLMGPEKLNNLIAINYQTKNLEESQVLQYNIQNLSKLSIMLTYIQNENENKYVINTMEIISQDQLNDEKRTIYTDIKSINYFLMSNGVYLERIEQEYLGGE